MSDPTRIRSGLAGKNWPEVGRVILAHWLTSRPDPFGQRLTQSARTKSDPGWSCTMLSVTSVENGTESKSGKLVAGRLRFARNRAGWFLHTILLLDQMCLAKPWPGHPDRIRVCFAQYDPYLLWKKKKNKKKRSWNGCKESDLACTIRADSAARWPKWP